MKIVLNYYSNASKISSKQAKAEKALQISLTYLSFPIQKASNSYNLKYCLGKSTAVPRAMGEFTMKSILPWKEFYHKTLQLLHFQ